MLNIQLFTRINADAWDEKHCKNVVILHEVTLKSLKYKPNVPKKNPLRFQKYSEIVSVMDMKAKN